MDMKPTIGVVNNNINMEVDIDRSIKSDKIINNTDI